MLIKLVRQNIRSKTNKVTSGHFQLLKRLYNRKLQCHRISTSSPFPMFRTIDHIFESVEFRLPSIYIENEDVDEVFKFC